MRAGPFSNLLHHVRPAKAGSGHGYRRGAISGVSLPPAPKDHHNREVRSRLVVLAVIETAQGREPSDTGDNKRC